MSASQQLTSIQITMSNPTHSRAGLAPTTGSAWQVLPGLCGNGSWGPFLCVEHTSGFRVTHFPAHDLVTCGRTEPAPAWHYRVMDALKADEPYTVAAGKAGNICHDVLGFLLWIESYQPNSELSEPPVG